MGWQNSCEDIYSEQRNCLAANGTADTGMAGEGDGC